MIKKLLYCAFAIMLLTACDSDEGNYSYHSLAEPDVSGIDNSISVLTYSRLALTPEISGIDEKDYDFEWRALSVSDNSKVTVIGNGRNLDYEVTLPSGSYLLLYKITDRSNGVYWQQQYSLQVSEATSEGWMVLCSEGDDNRVRLDMVSAVTNGIYKDVLKDCGMPVMYGPRHIQWSRYADDDSPYYLITADGTTRLGRNGFEWKEEYKLKYEMGSGDEVSPLAIFDLISSKMMVCGDRAYFAECQIGNGLFGNISDTPVHVAPYVGTNIQSRNILVPMSLLYDIDKKQFLGYAPNLRSSEMGGQTPLHEMNDMCTLLKSLDNGGRVTGNAFEKFPSGLDFVYMENTKYDPNNTNMGMTYTILKDDKNNYYVYGIQLGELMGAVSFGGPAYAVGKSYYGDLTKCTNISRATQFAFSSLNNYLYYAVNGTVYGVDLSESSLHAVQQISLPGETVTCMKFNIFNQERNAQKSYNLVVASMKGSEGILREYEGFYSNGMFNNVKPVVYSGLGRIVDVSYREMLN